VSEQRYHVEHGSCAYFVVDTQRKVAVATFPYSKELHRGSAYFKAQCEMRSLNEREAKPSRPITSST